MEFNGEIEGLKETLIEMRMELKVQQHKWKI